MGRKWNVRLVERQCPSDAVTLISTPLRIPHHRTPTRRAESSRTLPSRPIH